MRAWIGALVVGLSSGCSSGGAKNDGGAGSDGGAAGGRGGQAGGVAGQAGGAAGQAGGAAGQAGGASGQAGTAGGAGGRGGSAGGGAGASGRGGSGGGSGTGGSSGASGNGGRGGGSGGASGSGSVADGGFTACGMLPGLSFDSIDERECGLGPPDSGAVLCRWRISFATSTTFTWRHSDYVESGTYTCSGNAIPAQTQITAQTQTRGTVTATIDANVYQFTWDGVVYVCTGCPP